MKTFNMFDKIIKESIDHHVNICLERKKSGFILTEVNVPTAYSSRLYARMYDELTIGGRLQGWEFGVFSDGEKSITFVEDGVELKKYFLKYAL